MTRESESNRSLRKQLRWAWALIGCRCLFDKFDRKVIEDSHCPIHGWYAFTPATLDPEVAQELGR